MTQINSLTTEDEQAIRETVAKLSAGWNAGSGTQYAEPFTDDADFMTWFGRYQQGKQAIDASHQQIFDTFYKGTKNHAEIQSIRLVRPDVALVRTYAHLSRGGEQMTLRFGISDVMPLLVLVKNAGIWQVEAFQNTPIIPQS